MSNKIKSQRAILNKLGIASLNSMQLAATEAIQKCNEIILLSPTGSGKTLAYLLPVMALLETIRDVTQLLVLVPSRELAIQIEQVVRDMGSGYKVNAVYGGRSISTDEIQLAQAPTILVGTPGRIADHIRRNNVNARAIKTIVLDEFDKSLEVGFEKEIKEIFHSLSGVKKKVLTSATQNVNIPEFVELQHPEILNYLSSEVPAIQVKAVYTEHKDKLGGLVHLLRSLGNKAGIIFCNYKDTIHFLSDHLKQVEINHDCFYGGLEQRDRERALIKFRNGTHRLLVATDLAARGIDVTSLDFIIHYQLPLDKASFTHRNGRTARMGETGTAFVMLWEKEQIPEFIGSPEKHVPEKGVESNQNSIRTLFISGGRKDKISKGDIAGLFFKQGHLNSKELGVIELKRDCAFVAVPKLKANLVVQKTNNTRLKKKKVRITLL